MALRLPPLRPMFLHVSRAFRGSSYSQASPSMPPPPQSSQPRRLHTAPPRLQHAVPESAASDPQHVEPVRRIKYKINDANPETIEFRSRTGNTHYWDAAWLRDHCTCAACVSPSSGQKSFATADIPVDITVTGLALDAATNTYTISWANDIPSSAAEGHISRFTADELHRIGSARKDLSIYDRNIQGRTDVASMLWDKDDLGLRVRRIAYDDWMQDTDAFWRGVLDLQSLGITILENVPQSETAVQDIAMRFGAIKETFYGRTWDVISKPQAENIAYTNSYLGLHSDMLYLSEPPKIQLLHCLENSCSGGDSLFSDARRTALEMMYCQPTKAKSLMDLDVQYHYKVNGFNYSQNRPVLSRSPVQVYWSPPFQNGFGSLSVMPADAKQPSFKNWHVAAAEFQRLLNHEQNVFRHRLQPGECVIFDNLRVLHGRTAFDTGSGRRWLKGAYVENDDYQSKSRHAPAEVRAEYLPPEHANFRDQLRRLLPGRSFTLDNGTFFRKYTVEPGVA